VLTSLKGPLHANISPADSVRLHAEIAEFAPWFHDATTPGSPLTSGQPLTDPDDANEIGQIYHGRGVVLLIDSLTYSAADIFAGGFQDHGIGPIVGTSMVTGGGGANVWRHEDLLHKIGPRPGLALAPLPGDATMTLAIRRSSRVRQMAGQPIEDVGVEAIYYAPPTVADVLLGNPGLRQMACEQFRDAGEFRIDVDAATVSPDGTVAAQLRVRNLGTLKFWIDGRLCLTASPTPGAAERYTVRSMTGFASQLRIEGYAADGSLKRARTVTFPPQMPDPPQEEQ
jgi:hypothetical protein